MPPASFDYTTSAEDAAQFYDSKIHGKTILVSGVTSGGLGAYFVQTLAIHEPRLIILAGRSLSKLEETEKAVSTESPRVEVRLLQLDLSSQEQVRAAAQEVNSYKENIDVLINNAAAISSDYATTKDGVESQLGTNYIGPFLFTNLIMGKILAAGPGARVINIASAGHRFSPFRFDDWSFENGNTYEKFRAYGQSKTANMLFSVALANKLANKGLLSFSVHPGGIQTNLGQSLPLKDWETIKALDRELGNKEAVTGGRRKPISQGASTYFVASFDEDTAECNGGYLLDCQIATENDFKPYALDIDNALRLWDLTETIIGQKFDY